MAEEEQEEKKGGNKLFLILGCLVLVGISVGGTFAAMKLLFPPPPPPVELTQEEIAEAEKMKNKGRPAIYYPIKPAIVANYNVRGRQRFVQVDITLLTREEDVVDAIEQHKPVITNTLLLIIGGQEYEDIQTAEGKELLRQKCLQALQKAMEMEIGKPGIEQVLFTNFVMQ